MSYNAPTIRAITATPVMAETKRPMTTASGSFPKAPLVLIDVETDQGITGRAYIFVYSPAALKPAVAVFAELSEMLTGRAAAPVDVSREMEAPLQAKLLKQTATAAIPAVSALPTYRNGVSMKRITSNTMAQRCMF